MMETTRRVYSKTPWETQVAYCRAIASSHWICVSGTTAVDNEGRVVAVGDAYGQTRACLAKISRALAELGVPLANVMRTRIYVTQIDNWPQVARAHREYFYKHPPACTMVEVSRLIAPELLVEIEADAMADVAGVLSSGVDSSHS